MARNENIELQGEVIDVLPGTKFRVKSIVGDKEHIAICTLSGKLRMNYIKIVLGDKVKLEVSPYDLKNGIITWRC